MTRMQLTLSMQPATEAPPRRPKRVYRLYLLSDRSANLLDQMRLITGIPKQNGTGFYSANRFRQIKEKVAKEAGIDFRLNDFRPTLCTMTVQEDRSRLRHGCAATELDSHVREVLCCHQARPSRQAYPARLEGESHSNSPERRY